MGPFHSLKVPTVMIDGITFSAFSIVILLLVIVLAAFALRGRGLKSKLGAVALAMTILLGLTVAYAEQLSYAKELDLAWLKSQGEDGVRIYGTYSHAPETIDLWMEIKDEHGEPRSRLFFIPWSEALERSLAQADAAITAAGGGELMLRIEPSLEKEPQFYPIPQLAPPPKDEVPQQAPRRFVPSVSA